MLFYCFYSGLETVTGLWAASCLTEQLKASPAEAATGLTVFWSALTIGRLNTGLRRSRHSGKVIIRRSLALVCLAVTLLIFVQSVWLFIACLGLLGFGLAPLYPTMMHEAPKRVGEEFTDRVVSFQVGAALAGAALWPILTGFLVEAHTLALLPVLLAGFAFLLIVAHEVSAGLAAKA